MRMMLLAATVSAMILSGAAGAQEAQLAAAGAPQEKLICKTQGETGSLVRKTKRCFSAKDWARIIDSQQRGSRKLVDELTGRPPMGN